MAGSNPGWAVTHCTPWEYTPRSSSPQTTPQHSVHPLQHSAQLLQRGEQKQAQQKHQECPPWCQGCSESPLSHEQTSMHTHTHAHMCAHTPLPAHGTWANVRQRDAVAHTGEDGFVSVLGGTSRDLQLLRTDKVGWDFLQEERTTMRKTPLLLLVSSCCGRAGPPGNERLAQGPSSITRDVSSWDEPCP